MDVGIPLPMYLHGRSERQAGFLVELLPHKVACGHTPQAVCTMRLSRVAVTAVGWARHLSLVRSAAVSAGSWVPSGGGQALSGSQNSEGEHPTRPQGTALLATVTQGRSSTGGK